MNTAHPMNTKLDAFDLQLLGLVQADARLSQAELGVQVNLSTAAVNRRLKQLNEDGVITGYAAVVEPSAVGYPLTIIAGVETESERVDLLDDMKRIFASCPEVQQCYYVTGDWDFILILTVTDMEHYSALTRQLFFTNNNVRRFKTFVTMSRVKVGLTVPVGPLAPEANNR
jgi:Lrp/AsnC family transcriptional regulator, leucine-responsive regulatory protein